MNYLAHIYLSGNSDQIRIGNFIGDFVKGRKFLEYPEQIARGIILHRKIDAFTDQHPLVKDGIRILRPGFGKHAGIVMDVFLDHFLAANWSSFSQESLVDFVRDFHILLLRNFHILPAQVRLMIPFLIQNKRLISYANSQGVEKTLEVLSRRTSVPDETAYAMNLFHAEYPYFKGLAMDFLREVIQFVVEEEKFDPLLGNDIQSR